MKAVFALAISASAMGGCATYSTYHPPGRYEADYEFCLVNHMNFPDVRPATSAAALQKDASSQLTSLVDGLVSGKALTRDVYKRVVYDDKGQIDKEAAPSPAAEDLRYAEAAPFQQFLDCYLGPVDPIDFDTRLLRGHTVLAILAEYAAVQITDAPPAKRKDYAKTALSGIMDAELSLESGSYTEANQLWGKKRAKDTASNATSTAVSLSTTLPPVSAHSVANVGRVKQILELGALADSVATRNFFTALTEFVTSQVSNSSPTAIAQNVAEGGLKALTTTASINNFGAAYFQESAFILYPITKCTPSAFAAGPAMCESTTAPIDDTGTAVKELLGLSADGTIVDCTAKENAPTRLCLRHAAWQRWNITIEDACTRLSGLVGNTNTNTCLPTPDQLQKVSVWVQRGSGASTPPAKSPRKVTKPAT